MSGVQIASAKAPWVMFERRAEEDRAESIKQGRYVAKDVDFVLITPHGSKDQIERVVSEWLDYLQQQVGEGRVEPEWPQAYRRAYQAWLEGKETPVEGTAIINWPVASPAQIRMLVDLHVLTVEVLAEANSELIARMGMGGRALVEKAKAFVAQANGPGKVAEQLTDLRTRMEATEAVNKILIEQNNTLRAQMAAVGPAPAPAPGQPQHLDNTQGGGITADDLGLGTKL